MGALGTPKKKTIKKLVRYTVMFHIYGSAYRIILHQKPKPLTIFCAQMVEVTAMKPIAFKEIAFLLSMVIFSDF